MHTSQGPLPVEWAFASTGARAVEAGTAGNMAKHDHMVGLKMVGEMIPQERNMVTLADEDDGYDLEVARVPYNWCDNEAMMKYSADFMSRQLEAADAKNVWHQDDGSNHLAGTARLGNDRRTGVVNFDCRSEDIPNLFIGDGSMFPSTGRADPSLTIPALAKRGER